MEPFIVIVECAIEYNNKFLIIRRPDGVHAAGLLAFPGGKVDYQDGQAAENIISELQLSSDILLNATKREIFEEVGLDLVDPLHFIRSSYFVDKYGHHVLDVIFHCKIKKTHINITASAREVPEYFWLTKDEILNHQDSPIWLIEYIKSL